MKPVLAFVLGIALASGVGYLVVRKKAPETPAQVSTSVPPVTASQPVTQLNPAQSVASSPALPEPTPVSPPPSVTTVHVRRAAVVSDSARRSHRPTSTLARNNLPPAEPPYAPPTSPQNSQPARSPEVRNPAPITQVPEAAPAPATQERAEERPPERTPQSVTIPAGTLLTVRLDESLSSDRSMPGDVFRATLDQPLVIDRMVIAERGARLLGKVVETDKGGKLKGVARLNVALTQLNTSDGQKVKVQTEEFVKQAASSRETDVAKIGGGAALGAIIGAIAGGGKGAAIGAGVGGAAGGADVALTRGKAAVLPVETKLTFRVRDPITLTERLN